jgi:hypothetical protein
MVLAAGVTQEFCAQYNMLTNVAGGTVPTASNSPDMTPFTGTFSEGTAATNLIKIGSGDKTTALYNVKTGCFFVGGARTKYNLYYVLLQR